MYIFIVNPIAGNGKAKKIYHSIRHLPVLRERTIFYVTEYKGHIEEMMREIEEKNSKGTEIELLFIIGGDGTVHEVINSLTQKIPISYIPGGSGNDFSRGINNYKQPQQIIKRAISERKEAKYWLGTYKTDGGSLTKFVNSIGFGFDAAVVKRAKTLPIRKLLSMLRLNQLVYLFALLSELIHYKPLKMSIRYDDGEKEFSRVLFATVSNQPYMGGGMKVNPHATNNEHYFSILVVDSIPKWKVFLFFGTVFFGKHTMFKEVHTFQSSQVTITAQNKIPYQVDGEDGEIVNTIVKKHPKPMIVKGTKSNHSFCESNHHE